METLQEWEAKERFDDYLNEGEPVIVLGMTYEVAWVLKRTDPIAYEVTFADWVDAMAEDFLVVGYTTD